MPTRLDGRRLPFLLVVMVSLAGAGRAPDFEPKPQVAGDLPLVFRADFEKADLSGWDFTDKAAWRITDLEENRVLDQFQASKYQPKVRSPFNIALIPDSDVGDFVLDLKVRSTARDYGHRDLCLFFGHQDPSHFYYVHMAKQADPHANNIFLVNNQPRIAIAEATTKGTNWTDGWHHVRLVRKIDDGLIQVFFDNMTTPIMTAHDRTFSHGRVGVGSFDDTGQFDDIQLWGAKAKP
ncbi:MAG: hypothetical protein IRY99_16940 [Isosphaeraceae bacterium]|nr:hypothetical protein [Isosphaeraceae bacterium]